MAWAAPKHCPRGHPPFTGKRCPECMAQRQAAHDARRPNSRQRGYTSKWEAARAAFLKLHPRCACGAAATVVDHITPHKGDMTIFWDKTRWRQMCASCHGKKTVKHDGGFGNRTRGGFEF